jgi:hypothetical protein
MEHYYIGGIGMGDENNIPGRIEAHGTFGAFAQGINTGHLVIYNGNGVLVNCGISFSPNEFEMLRIMRSLDEKRRNRLMAFAFELEKESGAGV